MLVDWYILLLPAAEKWVCPSKASCVFYMKHDAWSIIRVKNLGKWISEHWARHSNACSHCSVWWYRPTKTTPGKCFNEKKTKNKEKETNQTQPRQKKGFQWKKRPTRGSKKGKKEKKHMPTYNRGNLQTLENIRNSISKKTPTANPNQQRIFLK